ncbi:MAG: sporulation transcription factor Spo0A [Clostridia bacterium]|nr:sporulation transcription factor Spo0A [Clostridia bacterium]
MKTRIMLVDDNEELLTTLKEFFASDDTAEIVATAADGEKALEMFERVNPDVLVLDLVMPGIDGFEVMERLDKRECKILVLSALSQDAFVTKAMNLGADYFMRKPANPETLRKRIAELMTAPAAAQDKSKNQRQIKNRSLEEKITNIFITVGIPAHIKGYQFLREAIKLAIDNPDIINSITKKLYPEVAEKFDTSPSKVERAIRHAIEVAWNRGKIENINSLFGVRVYSHNEKPTNGEFIALVADKMLLESV